MYLILLTLIIFMLDLNTPLGIAGGVPYILIMLLAFSLDIGVVFLWGIAILCSVLVITGLFLSPISSTPDLYVLTNRAAAVVVIWVGAWIAHRIGNIKLQAFQKSQIEKELKAKNAFLANISHELKTPLTAIIGYAQLLQTEPDVESLKDCVARIIRNATIAKELIYDILDLSKLEVQKLQLRLSEFSLTEELSEIYHQYRLDCEQKGVQLKIILKSPVPERLYSDVTRVRQILVNLISNAIKFTSVGYVQVLVSVEHSNDYLIFKIEDTGIGIREEDFEKVFLPFLQLDGIQNGTGLGLTLSKSLAKLLGGDLVIGRSQLGKGSTFIFSMKMVCPEGTQFISDFDFSNPIDKKKLTLPTDFLQSMKILICEDSIDIQFLYKTILTATGAEVSVANDGIEAVEKAAGKEFDLILMDLQMPSMNGYEASRHIRMTDKKTPILAMTAGMTADAKIKALDSGCTDCQHKPVDFHDFLKILKEYQPS